jgi:Zn-dependent alcohol dehydrogenase
VGLLAIIVARTLGAKKLYAIDLNESRLQMAKKHGAKPLKLNQDPQKAIFTSTQNRGADVVVEAVGHGDALRLAYPQLLVIINLIDLIYSVRLDSLCQLVYNRTHSRSRYQNVIQRTCGCNLGGVP